MSAGLERPNRALVITAAGVEALHRDESGELDVSGYCQALDAIVNAALTSEPEMRLT